MPEPIRLLHFADLHLGMENHGRIDGKTGFNSRILDFLASLDRMIDYARDHDVDLTIFAGDAFKTRTPNPTYQREFAYRVRELAALAPLVMLVGNHDLPPMALKASSIEIYDTLAVPNVYVIDQYVTQIIETKRGGVVVGAAPYPLRSRLLEDEQIAGKTIAETDAMMRYQIMKLLDMMADEADDHDLPRVLTGHFSIDEATTGSERQIMLGRDISVPATALADPRWDYVALGHIHKHQNVTQGRADVPPVVYSGSMERIDFGEEGHPKGFCWVTLERERTQWEFVNLPVREFVTIRADLRESPDPTQDVVDLIGKHALRDAVVRLILEMTPETEIAFNESLVRGVLQQAGVSVIAAIKKDIEHPHRMRLGNSPEGMTDAELLDRYLQSRERDEIHRLQLLEIAQDIFDQIEHE